MFYVGLEVVWGILKMGVVKLEMKFLLIEEFIFIVDGSKFLVNVDLFDVNFYIKFVGVYWMGVMVC